MNVLSTRLLGSCAVVGALLGAAWVSVPEASANPLTCEHRSMAHLAEHGGRLADDAYHLSRGEPANCEDKQESQQRDDQDDKRWHRDRLGPHIGPVWSWFN